MRPSTEYEAIVVGAGPAGSTAAREIAARGHRVLLLDRARFPRDKPCGGAVTIRCTKLLPFSIEPVIEDVITGATIRRGGGRTVTRDHGETISYMTQRSRLDHFLVEQAQQGGVEFRDGQRVTHIERLPDGSYELRAGDAVHHTPVVIGADGANGVVGTALGYEHARESAVALEGNIDFPDGVPDRFRGRVHLHFGWSTGGYGWVFPKGDHINVGVGGWRDPMGPRLRPALDRICRAYGLDRDSLHSLRGHNLPMQRAGMAMAGGGSALVGDAAGLVDPLSGEGIGAALASGCAVAPAVHDYLNGDAPTLAGYHSAVTREVIGELEASRALMEIFHAAPAPFVWLLQRSDRVWDHCARLLRGEETYDGLVNSWGPVSRALGPLTALARLKTGRR